MKLLNAGTNILDISLDYRNQSCFNSDNCPDWEGCPFTDENGWDPD